MSIIFYQSKGETLVREEEEVVEGEGRQLRELPETFGVVDGHDVAVHLDLKKKEEVGHN